MSRRHWIHGAIGRRGTLHRALGIPLDRRIPGRTLKAAVKAPGTLGRRARLALELRGFRHRGR
jgi:hypothetical protein